MLSLKKALTLVAALSILLISTNAHAQAEKVVALPQFEGPGIPGLTTCEGITSRTVQFGLIDMPGQVLPNQEVVIKGNLINTGKLILDNVDLYLTIRKSGSNTVDLVEYTKYAENIQIAPGMEKYLSYTWKVPNSIVSGDYISELSIVTGDRKVIPVDTIGGQFTVASSFSPEVQLVSVKSVPGKIGDNVTVRLKNLKNEKLTVPVGVRVYLGDDLNGKVVETRNQGIALQGNATAQATIPVSSFAQKQKTLLVGYQTGFGSTEYRKLVNTKEINGLGIGGIYQNPDQSLYAFTCFNPFKFNEQTKTKVSFEILNAAKEVIKQFDWSAYSLQTSGAIHTKLTPEELKKMGGVTTLNVSLFQDDALVEKVSYIYSCEEGDEGGLCGIAATKQTTKNFLSTYKTILLVLLGVAVAFFFVSTGFYKKIVGKKFFILTLLAILSFSFYPGDASANVDWRARIKTLVYDNSYASAYSYATYAIYDFGAVSSNFYTSYLDYKVGGLCGANCYSYVLNHFGYINGVSGSLAAGGGWGIQPPRTFYATRYYGPLNSIQLPFWTAVYVIDPINPTSVRGAYSGNYGSSDGQNKYAWGQSAGGNVTWTIPVGTRLGFLISGSNENQNSSVFGTYTEGTLRGIHDYVESLPSAVPTVCENDGIFSSYAGFPDKNPVRLSEPCAWYPAPPQRHSAAKLIRPQIDLTGLDNFSCEALQSDGTMECVAVSAGTSTPRMNIQSTSGSFFGWTTYNVYREGDTYASGGPSYYYGTTPPLEAPHLLELNRTAPDLSPMTVGQYVGANNSVSSYGNIFMGNAVSNGSLVTLPSGVNPTPFGTIVVVPKKTPPEPPVVTQVGTPWSNSGTVSYVFEAVATEEDANEGIIYEADMNNDGFVDDVVRLDDCYNTELACVDQPNKKSEPYPNAGYFSWDPSGVYVPTQYSLRFNGYWTTDGTKTFKVRTKDNTGLVSTWTTVTVDVDAPPAAPGNFTSDYGGEVCIEGITLSWDEVAEATEYRLYRFNNDTWETDLIATIPAGTNTYYDNTYLPEEYTTYYISSYASGLESATNSYSVYLPLSCDAILPPDYIDVQTGSVCGGFVDISWSEVPGADGYQIQRLDTNYAWQIIDTVTGVTTYTDETTPGQYQEYRIRSIKGGNVSTPSYSYGAYASDSCLTPGLPTNVQGQTAAACGFKVNLTWAAPTSGNPPTGYKIYQESYGWYYLIDEITDPDATSYLYQGYDTTPMIFAVSSVNEFGEGGPVLVNGGAEITPSRDCNTPAQCADTLDNDGNGNIDFAGGPNGEPADGLYCVDANDDLEGDPGCTRGSITRADGESFKFYSTIIASTSVGCEAYAKNLTCDNGDWKDSLGNIDNGAIYKHSYCRLNADVRER